MKYITVKDLIEKLSDIDESSIIIISHFDEGGQYFIPLEEKNINVGKFEVTEGVSSYSNSVVRHFSVHYSKLTEGLRNMCYTERDVENFENKNGINCVTFS